MSVRDNREENRFEMKRDGHSAYAEYHRENGILVIPYVYADPQLRGTGAASDLMQEVMRAARAENLRVAPVCSYAVSWMKRHPEHDDLLAG